MPTQRTTPRTAKIAKAQWNSKGKRRADTRRKKISTTVAAESYAYLEGLIDAGKATNLAEAIDLVLAEARLINNRERLDRMTAEAYENMSPEAITENKELEEALVQSVGVTHIHE